MQIATVAGKRSAVQTQEREWRKGSEVTVNPKLNIGYQYQNVVKAKDNGIFEEKSSKRSP